MVIRVGENRGIIPSNGDDQKLYFEVTLANVANVNRYDKKNPADKTWLFTDADTADKFDLLGYHRVELTFNEINGILEMQVGLMRAGRRTRKVKKSKSSKKRSTTRRRRLSKRMSRKMNKRRR